tara:strand:- start:62 stop:259 length:198 start_codon:yes stop_codon:yes gene_type:complete
MEDKKKKSQGTDRKRFRKSGEYFDGYSGEWDNMYYPENASRAHDYIQPKTKFTDWGERQFEVDRE